MDYQTEKKYDEKRLLSRVLTIKNSGQKVTICQNPILPDIIHQSWGWPFIYIEFEFQDRMVAHVSFVRIRKNWVSLPHFDHDSLWVDAVYLQEHLTNNDFQSSDFLAEISSFFFHRAIIVLEKAEGVFYPGTVISVKLEPEDFRKDEKNRELHSGFRMLVRNRHQVFPFCDRSKVIPELLLPESYDDQWEKFSSNVRRKIRKARKNGIVIEYGGVERVHEFYDVYRKNIRGIGSFALPKRFFKHLVSGYRFGEARVFIATIGDKIVGGAILLTFSCYAENAWFATLQDYNRYYVSYALHDAMIRFSADKHSSVYSFGRSTVNSSGHRYKQQWGTTDIPMILSSSEKIRINPAKLTFAKKMIRLLPEAIVNRLDNPVSRIIY